MDRSSPATTSAACNIGHVTLPATHHYVMTSQNRTRKQWFARGRCPLLLSTSSPSIYLVLLQLGDGFGFLFESGHRFPAGMDSGENHLESDRPLEVLLTGLVDDAHAAAAQFVQDLIAGNRNRY